MNFVKSFNLLGVEAQQIPCITGEGAPTTTTEGAVGCLYMDTTNGAVYKCIGVEGGAYTWIWFKEVGKRIAYKINGTTVNLSSKYDNTTDYQWLIEKKGGNNLFDFYSMAKFENADRTPKLKTINWDNYFCYGSGDWHAPFVIGAKNNIDGDNTSETFTGGSHQYNNQNSGSIPTARTESVTFYADGVQVTEGTGFAEKFEMRWTNYVQAYNTKKADGSGREVLKENHSMIFDGEKFEWKTLDGEVYKEFLL
jgi:hypothetical protein